MNEPTVRWHEVRDLYKQYKGRLFFIFFLFAGAVFIWQVIQAPEYKATASFRQSPSKNGAFGSEFKSFLKEVGFQQDSEIGAQPLMHSRFLMLKVVQELGLQLKVKQPFLLPRIKDNIVKEFGAYLPESDTFSFKNVRYDGERPKRLFFRFLTPDAFEVLNKNNELLNVGKLGEPTFAEDVQFTLEKAPDTVSLEKLYTIKVSPWPRLLEKLKAKFKIKESRTEKNILNLTFSHPNRFTAAHFLNRMMSSYQKFLKEENEQLTQSQLVYLENRQEELAKKLDHILEEHATYLKENLGNNGFIALNQELEILAVPKEEFLSRLFDTDLELRRMQMLTPDSDAHTPEFEGISLETARKLHLSYTHQLDEVSAVTRELLYIAEQMHKPEFELSSLSSILGDPISQEMVQKAGQLELQLRDESNRSGKEQQRLKESLELQKQFISEHIKQMVGLKKLRGKIIEKKLGSLQNSSIHLIKAEKKLIEEKLQEIQQRMADLPEKWRLENQLKLKTELGKGMMEGMVKLVELKNLDHHLYQVESKPLDHAIFPVKPVHGALFILSLFSGLFGSFTFLSFCLVKKVMGQTHG